MPRRADGHPLGRVLIGPVNTAIGLAEKSSLPGGANVGSK